MRRSTTIVLLCWALVLAAPLGCGKSTKQPTPPATNVDIFEMTAAEKVEAGIASLPANLYEAIQELKSALPDLVRPAAAG